MKLDEYKVLVGQRKRCSACQGLVNPSAFDALDSSEIGPWTRLHGDLDARLMVVGQDWGDVAYFKAHQGLDDLSNPTMLALEGLLASVGVNAPMRSYDHGTKGLFLTNAVLCLKAGGLQAKVREAWFTNCGRRFLRQQVELIRPRVVVPLGASAYSALCSAFGVRQLPLRRAVESRGVALMIGTTMVPVYHCGKRVQNTHRPLGVQREDWKRVQVALNDA